MAQSGAKETFIHQNNQQHVQVLLRLCFDCCDGVYDSTSKTQATDLERTQNFAIRCILKLPKRASYIQKPCFGNSGVKKSCNFWQLLLTIVAKCGNFYELSLGVLFVMKTVKDEQ